MFPTQPWLDTFMNATRTRTLLPQHWVVTSIVDTRNGAEVGDKWVRLNGTGDRRPCDHCGAPHEIHVTVCNQTTNTEMVVGSTCAKHLGSYKAGNTVCATPTPYRVAMSNTTVTWRDTTTGATWVTPRLVRS